MLKKSTLSVALAAAFLLGSATVASAIPNPSASPYTGNETQSNSAAPGAAVTFTSENTNLLEDTDITIEVDGPTSVTIQPAVTTTQTTKVRADGTFSFSVTVPANAAVGSVYQGTASGTDAVDSTYVMEFSITVVGADTDEPLAYTGSADVSPLLWVGFGALGLGLIVVVSVAIRRRTA